MSTEMQQAFAQDSSVSEVAHNSEIITTPEPQLPDSEPEQPQPPQPNLQPEAGAVEEKVDLSAL